VTATTTRSAPATDWWRHRRGADWALSYWHSIARPHRTLLLELLRQVEPFTSVVELGCGAAPCLRLIQARYPGTHCHGIDINVQMLLTAFEESGREGWDRYLDLEHDDLVTCRVPPACVVFSSYSLAYVHPTEIARVVNKMLISAARAVVIVEPLLPVGANRDSVLVSPSEWGHPYEALIQAHAGWETGRWPLAPPESRLNGAILARRTHLFSLERSA